MRRTRYQFGTVELRSKKRGPAVWTIRLTDPVTGKRMRIELGTFTDLPNTAAAERAAEQYRLSMNPDTPNARGAIMAGLIDRYLAEELSPRFSTSRADTSRIEVHIRPKWQDYPIREVKPFAVEQWLKGMKCAPKTKGHIKSVMMCLMNAAMRWELIDVQANPMALVRVPNVSKRLKKPVILSIADFYRLLDEVKAEPYTTMMWLAICLGLTASEISGLKWEDFDSDNFTVFVRRGVCSGRVGETKNEYREAPLPIDPTLAEILLSWRGKTPWHSGGDWMFASAYSVAPTLPGEKPINLWNAQTLHLAPAGVKLGLGRVGWHAFRHTYSSMLRELHVDVKVQQELLRHSDIRTTMNIYTQAVTEQKRAAQTAVTEHVMSARVQ
jgi:integrase